MADTLVVPIATFDDIVVERRQREGLGPALDRLTLRGRLDEGGTAAAPPVREVVFVGMWGRTGLTSLSRLGGYGKTVLLVHPETEVDGLELAECDWRGIGAASVDAHGDVTWLVRPSEPRSLSTTNMRFEQILDLAHSPDSSLRSASSAPRSAARAAQT